MLTMKLQKCLKWRGIVNFCLIEENACEFGLNDEGDVIARAGSLLSLRYSSSVVAS
jgi:hypothetical protein